jgi:hypothetical protein
LAKEWHPTKNVSLPEETVAGTRKSFWWKCDEGPDHEWMARGADRLRGGTGCPFCFGLKASVTNRLSNFPHLVEELHPTKNGTLDPEHVVATTNRMLWWKCPKGPDHEWRATGRRRAAQNTGCPFCAGRRLSITNSLNNFPSIAAEFHPTKNGSAEPSSVIANSSKYWWWICSNDPSHFWRTMISNRTRYGQGCPSCSKCGYRPNKTGALYILCGQEWGKFGISNVLRKRLVAHAQVGVFGNCVIAVEFQDGTIPLEIERRLRTFIYSRTSERAPKDVHGHTESFPASMLNDVKKEFRRLLKEFPEGEKLDVKKLSESLKDARKA